MRCTSAVIRTSALLLATVVIALLGMSNMGNAETVTLDPPELGGYGINATWPALLADDWYCSETGWVTGIGFWACWRSDIVGQVDSLLISIHESQGPWPEYCHRSTPANIVWSRMLPGVESDSQFSSATPRTWCNPQEVQFVDSNNTIVALYDIELDSVDWFWQQWGIRHWLSITAVLADTESTSWGIVSSTSHWGGLATMGTSGVHGWEALDYYYVCGDFDADGQLTDNDKLLAFFACGYQIFPCHYIYPGTGFNMLMEADGNCIINISDCVRLVSWYYGGPPPACCGTFPPRDSLAAAFTVTAIVGPWICGDPNRDSVVNVADAVYLIDYIFGDGWGPDPMVSGDVNCDEVVNVSDAVYLLTYIFGGGPGPCAECPRN